MLKITSILFASTLILNAANEHTLVFTSMKNIENAKAFIKKYFKNNQDDVFIVKYKDRYRVTYGSFSSRSDLNKFKKNLPLNLKKLDNFPAKKNKENTLKVIYGKNKVIDTKKAVKKVQIKKETKPLVYKRIAQLNPAKKDTYNYDSSNNYFNENKSDISLASKEKQIKQKNLKIEESQAQKLIKKNQPPKVVKKPKKSDFVFKADVNLSSTKIDNSFTHSTNGTNVNLDLDEVTVIPKFTLAYKNHSVFVSYFNFDQKESKNLSKTTIFNDTTYNAGTFVKSQYATKWYKTGYRYKINNLSLGLDFHDYSNEFSMNDSLITKDFFFPALAFSNEHNFGKYNILYGASWGKKSGELKYNEYYLSLGVNDLIVPKSNLSLGYKEEKVDIEDNRYDGNTKYKSTYLNFEQSF